jgi:hypothetical protein
MRPARRAYDPLTCIPSPEPLRRHLAETRALARRLRILLRLSERLHRESAGRAAAPQGGESCR